MEESGFYVHWIIAPLTYSDMTGQELGDIFQKQGEGESKGQRE
jgi:hypothetical protein